jgi:single-strand DNA-binding protein
MMNKVMLTGRLTRDPELRYTTSNVPVCEFTIATNRPVTRDGERVADFITCVAWRGLAENLSKYQSKGNLVGVVGSMRTDTFDKADGTKGYKTYVLADEVEFLESKKTAVDVEETPVEAQKNDIDIYKEFGEQMEIDESSSSELPFQNDR